MKKVFSILLSIVLIFSHAVFAFAAIPGDNDVLKFDENGEFKIFNICDIQDDYPMNITTKEFIKDMIKLHSPDLVVLGGDNSTALKEVKAEAIKELCDIFVESKTYFTFVFGNHDDEQDVSREELFEMYKLYGGKYCLAFDAVPSLTGVGTHNLTVKSSDGLMTGLGALHPDSEDIEGDIADIISLGLKGVKMHPDFQKFNIDDKKCYKIYELCEQNNLPVLLHMDRNQQYRSGGRYS